MSHVILNGQPFDPAADVMSWEALLGAVDQRAGVAGHIVSSVRFDGVDEPGFREPAILVRRLDTDLIVEIETEPPAALLGRILDEGAASLPALEQSAVTLAQAFRGIEVANAARGLCQLSESLMNLVTLVAAAATAAGARIDTLTHSGEAVGQALVALDDAVGPLLEAHAAGDYITVADTLEYDVAPAIPRLLDVIEALRQTAGAC